MEPVLVSPKTEEPTAEQITLLCIREYLASNLSQTAKLISIEQVMRYLDFNPEAVVKTWLADIQRGADQPEAPALTDQFQDHITLAAQFEYLTSTHDKATVAAWLRRTLVAVGDDLLNDEACIKFLADLFQPDTDKADQKGGAAE